MLDKLKWSLYYRRRCASTTDALRHHSADCKFVVAHVRALCAQHKAVVRSTRAFMRKHKQMLTDYQAHMQHFYDFVARLDMEQGAARYLAQHDSSSGINDNRVHYGNNVTDDDDDNGSGDADGCRHDGVTRGSVAAVGSRACAPAPLATAHSRTRVLHSVARTRRAHDELKEYCQHALQSTALDTSAAAHTRQLRGVLQKAHAMRERCKRLLRMADKADRLTWMLQRSLTRQQHAELHAAQASFRCDDKESGAAVTAADAALPMRNKDVSTVSTTAAHATNRTACTVLQQRIDALMRDVDTERAAFVHAFTAFVCNDVVAVATSCAHFGDVLQHLRHYVVVLDRFVQSDEYAHARHDANDAVTNDDNNNSSGAPAASAAATARLRDAACQRLVDTEATHTATLPDAPRHTVCSTRPVVVVAHNAAEAATAAESGPRAAAAATWGDGRRVGGASVTKMHASSCSKDTSPALPPTTRCRDSVTAASLPATDVPVGAGGDDDGGDGGGCGGRVDAAVVVDRSHTAGDERVAALRPSRSAASLTVTSPSPSSSARVCAPSEPICTRDEAASAVYSVAAQTLLQRQQHVTRDVCHGHDGDAPVSPMPDESHALRVHTRAPSSPRPQLPAGSSGDDGDGATAGVVTHATAPLPSASQEAASVTSRSLHCSA